MPATQGVNLTPDAVADVLSRVPPSQFKDGRFIFYDKLVFGRSPNWSSAKPLANAINCLLTHTEGCQANQHPFQKGAEKYFRDNGMTIQTGEVEKSVYRLRALVSQLSSQKLKQRPIPEAYEEYFSVPMGKIRVAPKSPMVTRSQTSIAPACDVSVEEISSDNDEAFEWTHDELFSSHDPDLVLLLQSATAPTTPTTPATSKPTTGGDSGGVELTEEKKSSSQAPTAQAELFDETAITVQTELHDTKIAELIDKATPTEPTQLADVKQNGIQAERDDSKDEKHDITEAGIQEKMDTTIKGDGDTTGDTPSSALPAESPLSDLELQKLLAKPVTPPSSGAWKELQSQLKA
eukprot:9486894-Pyramimonas_sp.AAC.1